MPIEFVVSLHVRDEYPGKLELPNVFFQEAYNGNRYMYVSGIRGVRKKVKLVCPQNMYAEIRGKKRNEFVEENLVGNIQVLHFVQEGDDTFYLTGYDHNGVETGGYEEERRGYYRFQTRVLPYPHIPQKIVAGFLPGLGNEADIVLICGGNEFRVHVNLVQPRSDGIVAEYVLNPNHLNVISAQNNLAYGDVVVFTKVGNNSLNVMAFNPFGRPKTHLQFLGASQLNLIQPQLDHEEKKDNRMEHICRWNGHREHFREKTHVFYKRFSEILVFSRLAIPGPFLDRHPMHMYMTAVFKYQQIEYTFDLKMDYDKEKPGRTNHVTAKGEWEQFGLDCHFQYNKMLRFRLLYIVTDLNNPQQLSYPFFHVC